ncbi:MAG: ornithine cyclodeaminase family protein [bacterium]|nr:ornithine cyclodeaminase family protein [bacterium]
MQLLVLDARAIADLLEMPRVIEAVEAAYRAYGEKRAWMPPKVYLTVPEGDFRAMPAYLAGDALPSAAGRDDFQTPPAANGAAAGVKWVNVHPGNPARGGLPTVMGLILLSDPATGAPLALLDGTLITRYRTGAAAAVATRHLARRDARTLGLVGCGGQGATHLLALACVIRPERVWLADARREAAEGLARRFAHLGCRAAGLEEACGADVVTTITPSRTPIVRRAWLREGCHINAMGADAPGKQELDLDVLRDARIIVDDWDQASHSGEINVAVARGLITGPLPTLPDVICAAAPGRTDERQITVFDSTGLAIQDLAVARYVYNEACRRGLGQRIEFAIEARAQ